MTTIALMLGIAHSLPIKTGVTRQTGVNAWLMLPAAKLYSACSQVLWSI